MKLGREIMRLVERIKERWFGVEAKLWFVLDSFYSSFLLKLNSMWPQRENEREIERETVCYDKKRF